MHGSSSRMFYDLEVVGYKRSKKKRQHWNAMSRYGRQITGEKKRSEPKRAQRRWLIHAYGINLMVLIKWSVWRGRGRVASCCRGFAIGTIGGAWTTGDDVDVAEQCTRRHYSPRLPSLCMRPSSHLISALDLRVLRVSTLTYSFLCIVLPSSEAG